MLAKIRKTISNEKYLDHINQIKKLPVLIEQTLTKDRVIQPMMKSFYQAKSFGYRTRLKLPYGERH